MSLYDEEDKATTFPSFEIAIFLLVNGGPRGVTRSDAPDAVDGPAAFIATTVKL